MRHSPADLAGRLSNLERQLRRTQYVALVGLASAAVLSLSAFASRSHAPGVVRTRALIIEDAQGRERVVLGAPVPDPKEGRRRSASTGLVINDSAGIERFGVGLADDGSMTMGLDAPPSSSSGDNRERITLTAGHTGGSELRFLDRESRVRAHIALFNDNTVALFFTDYQPGKTTVHRVGASGDTVVVHTP